MAATSSMLRLAALCATCLCAHGAKQATHHECAFKEDDLMDLHVYLSTQPRFTEFNDSQALVWHQTGIPYSTAAEERTSTIDIPLTPHLYANGTLFAHMFFTKEGSSPDPKRAAFNRWKTTSLTKPLVAYAERVQPKGLHNLITGEPAPWEAVLVRGAADAAAAGRPAGEYISYWKPALHVQLVIDTESHPVGLMPPLYENYLRGHRLTYGHKYRPLVYNNELTVMRTHWMALNASLTSVPLELSFKPLPLPRFQWMVNLQHSFQMNEETLGITEKESEDMRGMFVNTNPYLLYTTIGVSAVHLLFDVLAFKNDISFWSKVDSMEGLSRRSLIVNEIMEFVVLLYLIEEESSWLIKITSIFTLVLGAFKVLKSLRVQKKDDAKAAGGVSETDAYDKQAFRYLSPPLLLLVIGYSVYVLYTSWFRSWYSWLLEALVALVYGGGFIVMTPQLFINYRLKSVAHLNFKFFMYKALNTFIDDLFAFIIKMPTLHRMSCFRDDIVFAVFLYQRWVYRVDHTRVNEFGERGDGDAPSAAPAPAAQKGAKTAKESASEKKRK